jgi:hypothetical protein
MKLQTDAPTGKPSAEKGWLESSSFFSLGLLFIFCAILVLARANSLTFPLPNEDDARFFFPSWNLALHSTLDVPILNAPNGIFWTPHGFFVWLAIFLRLFGSTVEVAHWICQLTTAAASVLIVIAYARLCGSRAFALLCGLLLVSPGVVFAANTIRMESLILLLVGTGLLLHTYDRRIAAAAVFFLGIVVHPALLIGATLYALGIFCADVLFPLFWKSGIPRVNGKILTTLIVAAVAIAIALECVYIFHHLALFHEHMALQIERKAGRKASEMLISKRAFLLLVEFVVTAVITANVYLRRQGWRLFVSQLLPVFLLAIGLSVYATLGREIPYNVYSYCVVPATFFCLAYCVLRLKLTT